MQITTTTLTRAAGLAAIASGVLFTAVQVKHPEITLDLVTTMQWKVRQGMKVAMAILALVGLAGMYLRQVRQTGVLGLIGYVVLSLGYLVMLGIEIVGLAVVPAVAATSPVWVSDVIAVATGGSASGDVGLVGPLSVVSGLGYMLGGIVFGIAVFRAGVLARWAAALLALGAAATMAIPLLPRVNPRLFAVPVGVAMAGLGWSLWREHRSPAPIGPTATTPAGASRTPDPSGTR